MRTLLDPRRNPAFAIGHAGIDAESAVVHAERDAGLDDVIPEICHPPRMLCLSPAACLHLSHRPVRGRLLVSSFRWPFTQLNLYPRTPTSETFLHSVPGSIG